MALPQTLDYATADEARAAHKLHHQELHRLDAVADVNPAVGDVLKWDGTQYAPSPDLQAAGGTGWGSDFGYRFVLPAGNDANNGRSPDSAKATIQGAINSLPSSGGVNSGGVVLVGPGDYGVTTDITVPSAVTVRGAGLKRTRVKALASGINIFKVTGDLACIEDLWVTDLSAPTEGNSGINALSGIEVRSAQEVSLRRLRIDGIGQSAALGLSWDAGPAGIRVHGPEIFGDWHIFEDIQFRKCYRGMAISSGCNGWVYGGRFYSGTMEEKVYIFKKPNPGIGESVSWRFHGCHFASSKQAVGGYSVKLDHDAATSTDVGGVRFVECVSEISTAAPGWGEYYSNLTEVMWLACGFGNPNQKNPAGGPTIRVGVDASQNWVGPYTWPAGTLVFQRETGSSTDALKVWDPTDYTRSVTVV